MTDRTSPLAELAADGLTPTQAAHYLLALLDVACAVAIKWGASVTEVSGLLHARYALIAGLRHPQPPVGR